MAVLLTGVGYIGSALLERLARRGERVVGLENFYSTPPASVEPLRRLPGFSLVEGDVADPAVVREAFEAAARPGEPLVVYHLAAQPSAGMAAREPDYTERTNLVGARLVLESVRERGAGVVFGGSFRVYGDDLGDGVVDEDHPYGRVGDLSHLSKVYVEQLARMVGLPFVSVRLGVTYGRATVMKSIASFMTVPNVFCRRAARGQPLEVLEDRPMAFIHVDDAAAALEAAAAWLPRGGWQVVNAASEVCTIGEVAGIVQGIAADRGRSVEVHGAANGKPHFQVASRFSRDEFTPTRHMSQALDEVFGMFLAQETPA